MTRLIITAFLALTLQLCNNSVSLAKMTPEEIQRFRHDFAAQIFEDYADSVVYVTGEFCDPKKKALTEYFTLPNEKINDSIGTGFFVLPSGYLLTNAHGVHKSINQVVELRDGKKYDAEVVGFIFKQDISLLKIQLPSPVKAVTFKEDGEIKTGEPLVTIGHPHGLKYTCTQGIISATGRRSLLSDMKVTLDNLLQTDTGINPGSSGGPWFDASDEVVGMTASRRGDSDNIAFGVSSVTILRLLPELLDFPRRNGFVLGFEPELKDARCCLKNVNANSPAGKAGLKDGDVVVSVDGKPVKALMDFLVLEENFKPGQEIKISLKRTEDGKENTIDAAFTLDKWTAPDTNEELWKKVGLKVRPITEEEAKVCELKSHFAYVITEVNAQRYEKIEHKPQVGDILGKIAHVRPNSMTHFSRILDSLKQGDRINMIVLRVTEKKSNESVLNLLEKEKMAENETASTQTAEDKAESKPEEQKKNEPGRELVKVRIDISDFNIE